MAFRAIGIRKYTHVLPSVRSKTAARVPAAHQASYQKSAESSKYRRIGGQSRQAPRIRCHCLHCRLDPLFPNTTTNPCPFFPSRQILPGCSGLPSSSISPSLAHVTHRSNSLPYATLTLDDARPCVCPDIRLVPTRRTIVTIRSQLRSRQPLMAVMQQNSIRDLVPCSGADRPTPATASHRLVARHSMNSHRKALIHRYTTEMAASRTSVV